MAERHLKRTKEGGAFLFHPTLTHHAELVCAFDNNDICEETLSGFGTTLHILQMITHQNLGKDVNLEQLQHLLHL